MMYKNASMQLTADFSAVTMEDTRQWKNTDRLSEGRFKTVTQEFYIQQKHSSKMKVK